jgi:hypothetical protein
VAIGTGEKGFALSEKCKKIMLTPKSGNKGAFIESVEMCFLAYGYLSLIIAIKEGRNS